MIVICSESPPLTLRIDAEGAVLALGPNHLAVLCGDKVRTCGRYGAAGGFVAGCWVSRPQPLLEHPWSTARAAMHIRGR